VDLPAAVKLVRSSDLGRRLPGLQADADRRVLRATGFTVQRSDFWTYDAPRATVGGSDSKSYAVAVPRGITHLKVTLAHPSGGVIGGPNGMNYTVTVRDAAGRIVAVTEEASSVGTSSALVDLRSLRNPSVTYGAFTIDVSGDFAVSDPDTLDSDSLTGDTITLQVAQLTPAR
jgi:serine protease AprX